MNKEELAILDLVSSTNQIIQKMSRTIQASSEELENLRNDSIVFGSAMLALVELLVDKEIMTKEEFDMERFRKLACLDQELATESDGS